MLRLSWEDFHRDCKELAAIIKKSNMSFDKMLCIARGGVFVGGLLAHILNLRNLTTIALELYDVQTQRANVVETSAPDLPSSGSRILVVDDLLDSGKTLTYITDKWGKDYDLSVAVLYDKGGGSHRPTFCVRTVPQKWVRFPWETMLE